MLKLKSGKREIHGGYTFFRTGKLPEHRREVERYLTSARIGLIRDLAGTEERLTTAQVILIDRIVGKLGILRCMEEFVKEHSVFEGNELAPCLRGSFLAYGNSVRLDLQALGMDHKPGAVPDVDLAEYVEDAGEAPGTPAGRPEMPQDERTEAPPARHTGAKEDAGPSRGKIGL